MASATVIIIVFFMICLMMLSVVGASVVAVNQKEQQNKQQVPQKKQTPNAQDVKGNKDIDNAAPLANNELIDNPVYARLAVGITAGVIGSAVASKLLRIATSKAYRVGIAAATTKVAGKVATRTSTMLARVGAAKGAEYFARVGAQMLATNATKIKTATALKVAEKSLTVARTGFLAIFAITSLVLDLTDMFVPGGTVGYAKMGTFEQYDKIQKHVNTELSKALRDQGLSDPLYIGPLDKMDADTAMKEMEKQVAIIMDMSKEKIDPLMSAMAKAIADDIATGKLTAEQLESGDDTVMTPYLTLVNFDAVADKALQRACESKNGKMVINKKGVSVCTFATKEQCRNSYKWPLQEDEMYAEYKNGGCQLASGVMRDICEANNIPYNEETGTCQIDEKYCKTKGAEWKMNPTIGKYDCVVPVDQFVAEAIFGTTIVRGLKQVFDPQQYKSCPSGTKEAPPYWCLGGGCPPGWTEKAGTCFEPCKPGYVLNDMGWCSAKCPDGFTDYGLGCSKPPSYGNGVGTIPTTSCPSGYDKAGDGDLATCWSLNGVIAAESKCGPNQQKIAGLCYNNCKPNFHFVGGNVCSPNCPPETIDIGATCTKKTYVPAFRNKTLNTKERAVAFSTNKN